MSYKKRIFFALLLLIFLLLTVHVEPWRRGIIRDMKSGAPLGNVVVFRELERASAGPAGKISSFLRADETVSNPAGKYFLPPRIHFHFPVLSWVESRYTFAKVGYFPIHFEKKRSPITFMRKREYRLDFAPTADRDFTPLFWGTFTEKSKLYSRYAKEPGKVNVKALTPAGQFFRRAGSRFSQLFMINHENYFYVFDDSSQCWLKLNDRGEVLLEKSLKLPVCERLQSPLRSGSMVFLRDGEIHFPANPYVFESHAVFEEKDYVARPPFSGPIVDICHGANERIMTIEGGGTVLCEFFLRGSYPLEMVPGRTWNSEALFPAEPGQVPVVQRLHGIQFPSTYYYYLLAHVGEQWSIFRLDPKMGSDYPPLWIGGFAALANVSAAYFGFDSLFVAIEGEGVRRFILPSERRGYGNESFHEDRGFHERFRQAGIATVRSIAKGSSFSGNFLYMTDGGDAVYRFSKTGVPDRKVMAVEE